MPSLRPKPKRGGAWLPNQVVYGMDTSDPDPANWKEFGEMVDNKTNKTVKPAPEFDLKKPG